MNTQSLDRFDNDELLALAQANLESKDVEGALWKLKEIISRPDPLPEALSMIARVYAQLRLFAKAKQFFERYLQVRPQALLERFEFGMTQFDEGNLPDASRTWTSLLQDHPGYPPALFYTALSLARTGQSADAKQSLEELLKNIDTDNLYFERAKKLLQAIAANNAEQVRTMGARTDVAADDASFVPQNPHRTEH